MRHVYGVREVSFRKGRTCIHCGIPISTAHACTAYACSSLRRTTRPFRPPRKGRTGIHCNVPISAACWIRAFL